MGIAVVVVAVGIAIGLTRGHKGSSTSPSSPSVPIGAPPITTLDKATLASAVFKCNENSTTVCQSDVAATTDCILGEIVPVNCAAAAASEQNQLNHGCELYDNNFELTSYASGLCPPRYHGFKLARAGYLLNLAAGDVTNSEGDTFPSQSCPLRLGAEYGWDDAGEIGAIEVTTKTMATRMLQPATYTPAAVCSGSGLPNCCKCVDTGCTVFDATECKSVGASNIVSNPTATPDGSDGTYSYNMKPASDPYLKSDAGTASARVPRGMHGKGQACIPATFKVASDLTAVPPSLRVGILAKAGGSFDSLVRWGGNKNITLKDIHDIRVRAFSVKVFGIANSEDRVKISGNPSFDQPEEAQQLFKNYSFHSYQENNTIDLLHVAIRGPDGGDATKPPYNIFVAPDAKSYYTTFILGGAAKGAPPLEDLTPVYMNPLRYAYGSASSLKLGDTGAMRMHWMACPGQLDGVEDATDDIHDPDYMKKNLKAVLESQEFKMCGYIQIQENPCTESVENATQRWMTNPIHVFTVTMPKQQVGPYDAWCDDTVYDPFRTFKQHLPIGSINRIRTAIYAYSHNYRLMINNGVKNDENGFETIGANTCPFGSRRPNGYIPSVVVPVNRFLSGGEAGSNGSPSIERSLGSNGTALQPEGAVRVRINEVPTPPGNSTFAWTGNVQTFTPATSSIHVVAYGSTGGRGNLGGGTPGKGGMASATLTVEIGVPLYIFVGGGAAGSDGLKCPSYNGGGGQACGGQCGGGASDIRTRQDDLTSRIIVAGGGGGVGYYNGGGAAGGDGGFVGAGGRAPNGAGGTQSAGGLGTSSCPARLLPNSGALGQGGNGCCDGGSDCEGCDGGGGGGYYGGAGGGNDQGSGGGGSSFVNTSIAVDIEYASGVNAQTGYVTISPIYTPSGCAHGSLRTCIGVCPTTPSIDFETCVQDCVKHCTTTPAP